MGDVLEVNSWMRWQGRGEGKGGLTKWKRKAMEQQTEENEGWDEMRSESEEQSAGS